MFLLTDFPSECCFCKLTFSLLFLLSAISTAMALVSVEHSNWPLFLLSDIHAYCCFSRSIFSLLLLQLIFSLTVVAAVWYSHWLLLLQFDILTDCCCCRLIFSLIAVSADSTLASVHLVRVYADSCFKKLMFLQSNPIDCRVTTLIGLFLLHSIILFPHPVGTTIYPHTVYENSQCKHSLREQLAQT